MISLDLKNLSDLESLPYGRLSDLQLERLRLLVERLEAGSGFYAQKLKETRFGKNGVKAADLKTIADLARLPFTCKQDFQENYPFGLMQVNKEDLVRLHASSGTKGRATLVYYDRHDLDIFEEVCARALMSCGVEPSALIHNSYGYGPFTGGLGIHGGAQRLGAAVFPASGGKTHQQVRLLKDLQANVLCSTPSYALNLACVLEDMNISLDQLALEIGIFGAEPWSEALRDQLELRLGLKAFDIYGLSEIIGPGVAVECMGAYQRRQNDRSIQSSQVRQYSMHIFEDHFLAEIIDPKTLEVLPLESEGELVLTSISRSAMPVLRYRTGDITSLSREPCECGRTLIRMNRIKSRLDDMLIIRGVNIYPSEIESVLLNIEELSPHYQIVVERKKSLDELVVQVEVCAEIIRAWGKFEDDMLKFSRLNEKIIGLLKENLGLTCQVELLAVGEIPRSEGKAVRVIDTRGQAS